MPALVAGIHDFFAARKQGVDGRDKPGHDGCEAPRKAITCSRVTEGKPSRNSSIESPALRYSMSVCTGTRVPQKTGVPPMTSGSRHTTDFIMAAKYTRCSRFPTRHARPRAGHPRLFATRKQDVDGRDKPGHDGLKYRSNICRFTSRSFRSAIITSRTRTSSAW
jgi:hypothetical protein